MFVIIKTTICKYYTLTWCNQDLVSLGADAEEGEVILWVNIPDCAPGLHRELAKKSCILNSSRVVQSCSDGNT